MPPKLTGPSTNYRTKYFYHKDLNDCILFHGGGCQQTENLFRYEQDCCPCAWV